MSVSTYDPETVTPDPVRMTAPARAHIAQQLANTGQQHIRLGVKESGCNGFMYTLDYIDEPLDDDVRFDVEGEFALYVGKTDIAFVGGTEIDLVVSGLNSTLQFKNPNAESHCGCGESFSIASA